MATDKKVNYEMQGKVKNYLGKQKMVKAPLHWRSGAKHPSTELAYITKAEKNLLIKKDLHKSLKGGVNRGPSGIISLNGWGDRGEGFADKSYGGNERPGRDVQTTTGSPHTEQPRTVTRTTKTVSPKDHFEQSWTGPKRFFGLTGGYRDLKVPGDTSQGHKSRWGGLGRGLLSLVGGIPGKLLSGAMAVKNLGKHKTLSDWWKSTQRPVEEDEEEFTSDYQIGPDGNYQYVGGSMDDTMKEFRQKYPVDLSNATSILPQKKPDNIFNYKDNIDTMRDNDNLGFSNFNVNQNYGTKLNEPNSLYTTGANQNWVSQLADGGRIGYNRGRVVNPGGYQGDEFEDENTLEFMQDQGIPHSEMAQTSPFEMRIEELMDEGMSWQEAYQIASEEFGQLVEGESDQGLASIV